MSKRKFNDNDREYKNIKKPKNKHCHQFEPIPEGTRDLGNEVLTHYTIQLDFDDDRTLNKINNTKQRSMCKVDSFYLDGSILRIIGNIVESKSLDKGSSVDLKAQCLVSNHNMIHCQLIAPFPKMSILELGYIQEHENAQERSNEFCKVVRSHIKPGENVLTLDGNGRNIATLLEKKVCPASNIIVVEMKALTAIYHILLSLITQEQFQTVWTQGKGQRHSRHGIQRMINKKLLPNQDKISAIYLDFDCDIPKELDISKLPEKFPNLRICAITQTKRRAKHPFPTIGILIKEWNKGLRIRCKFMYLGARKIE